MGNTGKFMTYVAVCLLMVIRQPTLTDGQSGISAAFDIAVVVDIAGSQEPDTAEVLKDFFHQLSVEVGVSADGTHIGMIDLSQSSAPVLSISEGLSIDAVAEGFAKVQAGEGTAGDLSSDLRSDMKGIYDLMFGSIDNRPTAPDVMIIVTDGSTSFSGAIAASVAVAVVTVGANVHVSQLTEVQISFGVRDLFGLPIWCPELIELIFELLRLQRELDACENTLEVCQGDLTECEQCKNECEEELERLKEVVDPIINGNSIKTLCARETVQYRDVVRTDGSLLCLEDWKQRCGCEVNRETGDVKLCDPLDAKCEPCTKEICLGKGLNEERKGVTEHGIKECRDRKCGEQDDRKKRDVDPCSYSRDCVFDGSCCENYLALCFDPTADTSASDPFPTCYSVEEGCCDLGLCCEGTECI